MASRTGTRWDHVLQILVSYRLVDPGSEWRLHHEWFDKSAMADLLGADYRLAADDTLYRCLDQLTGHKGALFFHLQERWKDLFNARFDVLLYDLTSTYFESDPPVSYLVGTPKGRLEQIGSGTDRVALAAGAHWDHRQTAAAAGRVLCVCAERLPH